ncbi:hypothetical protein F4818DRAFT_408082 [Hypoxylon cercidicola]|nr:hypothetical protein F4818DRAFT_408082 [Hypoxylon cercidicola]
MTRTTNCGAFRYNNDDNFATPYTILTNGDRIMSDPSSGVHSSVNDLLKWCHCLLASFDKTNGPEKLVREDSPMFDRSIVANPRSAEDGDYCAGWCYHRTPGKLGLLSPNRTLVSPILGKDSPSILLYGHQGSVPGFASNLYIIPETKSALVILSNGTGLSDATDWIAQDLIQTMYKLQPSVDFVDVAQKARAEYRCHFDRDLKAPLERHLKLDTKMPALHDLTGTYINEMGTHHVRLSISVDKMSDAKLQMKICKRDYRIFKLWHYNLNVFCFLPENADKYLSSGLNRLPWSSFLVSFDRGVFSSQGVLPGEGRFPDELCPRGAARLRWKLDGIEMCFYRESS